MQKADGIYIPSAQSVEKPGCCLVRNRVSRQTEGLLWFYSKAVLAVLWA